MTTSKLLTLSELALEAEKVAKELAKADESANRKKTKEAKVLEARRIAKIKELSDFVHELQEMKGLRAIFKRGYFLPLTYVKVFRGALGFFGGISAINAYDLHCYLIDKDGLGKHIQTPTAVNCAGDPVHHAYPVRHAVTIDEATIGLLGNDYLGNIGNLRSNVLAHLKQLLSESSSDYRTSYRKTPEEVREMIKRSRG